MRQQVKRFHDICAGHRVVGHEGKCRHLHGHNYRIHFTVESDEGDLDSVGRVVDFSVVKSALCMWLEDNWDHKFLHWEEDSMIVSMKRAARATIANSKEGTAECLNAIELLESYVPLPFNPTAENLAAYLLNEICPKQLSGLGLKVTEVTIDETRKCSVTCKA